jgi:plastocyanin
MPSFRNMKRASIPALIAGAAVALGGCGGSGLSGATPAVPTRWQVSVGADRDDHALQALNFFTSTITIDAGDSITWTVEASEHTVAFLRRGQSPFTAPLKPAGGSAEDGTEFTSSGILFAGHSYTLTFSKPGTYMYHCLLHPPEMLGKVIVQRAGAAYPRSQAYYSSLGRSTANVELAAARAAVLLFPYTPGGAKLTAGISPGLAKGTPTNSTVYRFLDSGNQNLEATTTISVGTTVRWVNQTNNEPHTVTFPVAGKPLPPRIANNPFSPPTGGPTYDGTALTNSGPIGSNVGAAGHSYPNAYSLTFTKPGRYVYHCLFHDNFGMESTIVVK